MTVTDHDHYLALVEIRDLKTRVQTLTEALRTVRAECALPEHIAEIIGEALGEERVVWEMREYREQMRRAALGKTDQ